MKTGQVNLKKKTWSYRKNLIQLLDFYRHMSINATMV
jgi:hypothetical protein